MQHFFGIAGSIKESAAIVGLGSILAVVQLNEIETLVIFWPF
jgi:hypothetical protein